MGKYIHTVDSIEEFEDAYEGNDYEEPWVSSIKDVDNSVIYNKEILPEVVK